MSSRGHRAGRAGRVLAQAKINLGLRVLAREKSGYHTIETIFSRLALGDDVMVRTGGGSRTIRCRRNGMPNEDAGCGPPERNLAYRAALSYGEETGWPDDFSIDIEKRIPVGAGLGGGSADAGAVLRILNTLATRPVPDSELIALGASIGSDVAFLASTASIALGLGRGERLREVRVLPRREVVIVSPPFAVATADAYGWLDESRGDAVRREPMLAHARLDSWEDIARYTTNDLEEVVSGRHAEIGAAVRTLARSGAIIARMSGSGSAVFGIFSSAPPTEFLAATTRGETIITHTPARVVEVERME